jgi:signal peptidase I
MKRVLLLLTIILVCVVGYLSIWGYLPFVPVIGSGMEPVIRSGSLLITTPLAARDIKEGEIIVYKAPNFIRERYDYPPVVVHRVVEIKGSPSVLQFQTGSVNTGNDPFLVRAHDIRGAIAYQIPYLGLPLVFLNSRTGTILTIFFIILLALFLYSSEMSAALRRGFREFISPVIEENHRVNLVLSNRFEHTEKALESFAGAMQEYARHMASHTSAIQGLSEASQALKNSAVEQNQILSRFSRTLATERSAREVSQVKRVVSDLEKRTLLVLQVKDQLEGKTPSAEVATEREIPAPVRIQSPPGCQVNSRALYIKGHFFSKSSALRPLSN